MFNLIGRVSYLHYEGRKFESFNTYHSSSFVPSGSSTSLEVEDLTEGTVITSYSVPPLARSNTKRSGGTREGRDKD